MKDSGGHGSNPRGGAGVAAPHRFGMPSPQVAARSFVGSAGPRPAPRAPDQLDRMRTIANMRARLTGKGPGETAALTQGIRNLGGYTLPTRGRG